jgi:hypothetical protein
VAVVELVSVVVAHTVLEALRPHVFPSVVMVNIKRMANPKAAAQDQAVKVVEVCLPFTTIARAKWLYKHVNFVEAIMVAAEAQLLVTELQLVEQVQFVLSGQETLVNSQQLV